MHAAVNLPIYQHFLCFCSSKMLGHCWSEISTGQDALLMPTDSVGVLKA